MFTFLLTWSQLPDLSKANINQLNRMLKQTTYFGDVYSSVDIMEALVIKEGTEGNYWKLAEMYRSINYYSKAKDYYFKIGNSAQYPLASYFEAIMTKQTGDYEGALFKLKTIVQTPAHQDLEIKNEIAGCEIARFNITNPLDIDLKHLNESVNSSYSEKSPMLKSDSLLIFASVYSDSLIQEKAIEPGKKKNKNQFFKAVLTDGVWKGDGLYEGLMNASDVDVANSTFHPQSPYVYFTRCMLTSGKRKCDLYRIKKNASEPPEILPEPLNDPKCSSTQPALGTDKDGKLVLYFVSDRDGGKGRNDIWYATYDSMTNGFVNPQNAGAQINTRMDEFTPYYEGETRALYFSSNGWPGMGGFDIFKNIGNEKEWGEVSNVGYPLNSPADDLYYILNSNRDGGFLTSNRDGGFSIKHPNCCDDIYEFKQRSPVSSVLEVEVEGFETMLDSLGEPLVSLYLSSADSCVRMRDNKIVKELCDVLIEEIKLNKGSNKCFFKISVGSDYEIKTFQSGSLAKSLKVKVSKEEYTDTLKALIKLKEYSKDAITIKNIYYEYKKSELTDTSKMIIDSVLLKLLNDNPHIILEISSHTDSVGSFNYNYHLSQRRAKSVVDYLISNGIESAQLKAQGYGELKPIVHNTNLDGSDNVEGRAMNRRTEFRIIGEIKGKLEPEYSR